MLEPIRAYADERLAAAGERDAVAERHFRYFRAVAERHGRECALLAAGRGEHLAALDADAGNLHCALAWALENLGADDVLAMVSALAPYWLVRNRYAEALRWVDLALSRPAGGDPAVLVGVLGLRAICLKWGGRPAEQRAVPAEAEAIARRLGDAVALSEVLQGRTHQEADSGDLDAWRVLADEALSWAVAADDDWQIANACRGLALAASDTAELRERVDHAADLAERAGNLYTLTAVLLSAAESAVGMGSPADGRRFAERAVPTVRTLDEPFLWMLLHGASGSPRSSPATSTRRATRSATSSR
jgi:hypothetical protein